MALDINLILSFANIIMLLLAATLAGWLLNMTINNNARRPFEYLMYGVVVLLVINSLNFLDINVSETLKRVMNFSVAIILFLIYLIQIVSMRKKNYDDTLTRKNPIEKN